jgi:methyl-accepting chemotaxis protein
LGIYSAVERTFFNSLTKKIIGNVLFLLLPNLVILGISFWVYQSITSLNEGLGAEHGLSSELLGISSSLYIASIIMLAFTLVAALFSIFFMRHLFLRPIRQMTEVLRGVKDRDGDISATLPDQTFDEISDMASSYNGFSDSLKKMIADTRQRSVKVSLSASQLQKVILETKGSAQAQEEQAQKVFQASQESSQAIEGIATHTQNIAKSNDNNLAEIRDAGDEMRHVKEQMRAIEHQVSDFQTVVQQLSENSDNIIKVLNLVQDFSDQTNLLALNASIEAARAGEAGRGFSVVADEVRTLSQKVNAATKEIDSNVHEMVLLVDSTRSGASNIMTYVSDTDVYISQTSQKFESMIADFETVSGQMNDIGAAIEELSYTNNNTHDHVTEITSLSNTIKSEMELSAEHSIELENSTEEMQELLSRFSIGYGGFEDLLRITQDGAAQVEVALNELASRGADLFDKNYVRTNPDQLPEKYDTSYTNAYEQIIRPIFDKVTADNPMLAMACAFDVNGYLPAHNSKISQPMTGNFEKDNALSRHRRLYNATRAERRRAEQTSPFLLLTFIRDTGEIMNSISVPMYVNGQHWGNFCTGFAPDALLNVSS